MAFIEALIEVFIMAIVFLVLMIVFINKYYNAQKEIKNLKQQLMQYVKQDNIQTNNNKENISIDKKTEINKVQIKQKIEAEGNTGIKNKNSRKTKNTLILIAGAILIVLAAIVFLMSTWNTIPNIIKTGTLIFLIGVFLGASYLAKNKLKLDLTAKTFYYIAMAYIPIVLFSISVFKLFGKYLSISGEGKFLYFSICTILLSILYLFEVIRHNRQPLLICSFITQILAVIFTVLIFSTNYYNILLGIIIYTLIVYIISQIKGLEKINLSNVKKIVPAIYITTTVVIVIYTILHWIMANCEIIDILNIILVTFIYYLLQKKNKNLKFIFDIGLLIIVLTIVNLKILELEGSIKFFIMTTSILLLYLFNYLISHKLIYRVITYVSFNFLLLSIALVFKLEDLIKYIPFTTTLIILVIEMLDKSKLCKYYLTTSFIITFLALNIEINIVSFVFLMATIGVFIIYMKTEKMSKWFIAVPMVALIPSLYIPTIELLKPYYINIILSFVLIILTTCKSILNKKANNIYLYSSITYILLSIVSFEMNKYINLFLILLWAVIHLLSYEHKDIFKTIAYIAGLAIYNTFLVDVELTSVTILSIIGYLACIYLITRTVLKKYFKGYNKVFEYVLTSLIYIYALNIYNGITDAMIFILFLVVFVIFGYIKKVGPLFLISLIAIVVNIFKLTKDFWQSIPWWVYMLVVGSILISFAIRNEINEKEEKLKIRHIIKKLKDNVDL